MVEKTLAIIKPDAVSHRDSGMIISLIELNKFTILRMQKMELTTKQAELFYDIHKERPFFRELVDTMTQGPVIVLALEKEDAIRQWRDLMGPTDPLKAPPGTLEEYVWYQYRQQCDAWL